jgi:uncharacterized damage-inducible protein DinB
MAAEEVNPMNELARIRDQITRSLEGEAWHGPPLVEVLSGLDADSASARPIPNAHTSWEILLHMVAWVDATLSRLRGEARTLSPEEDWPTPAPAGDQDAWRADLDRLREIHRELLDELARLDASRLDTPIVPGYSSVYVTLHGLVQHNLYHAGQVALLKKAILDASS